MRPGAAFCTGCGAARDELTPSSPSTEDRRRVSVLFADQVESTRYAEQADPELVRQLQSRFYQVARTVVHEHGGVVEKYIGDAIMALFGAPIATEADPLRCVRAGLELQRHLLELAADHGEELRYRVGVATGEALVDLAAAHDGGQAIVAGDVVNTAARIQAIAPPGGVLVCGSTQAQTTTTIRYQPHAATQLRGRSAQTELFLAIAPVPRRPDGGEPDSTPLVERAHELDLLAGALQRAVNGRNAQLVTIFGQAGIGKSRLVRELRRRADRLAGTEVTWRVGNCPPFGQNVTYAGLTDIVKAQAGILDSDSPETARHRLDRAVRQVAHGAEADRLVEALGPLMGLPGTGGPPEEAESAWRRFLVRLAQHRPAVLVFEDLHWADESMRRFIELLAAAAREVPLLVLTTARPELVERDASWAGTITGSLTITLPPLRNAGMVALCRHMLGKAVFTAEALRPLVEITDGNPLYAQEYVRMLVERGAVAATLLAEPNGAGLVDESVPMPDSVHGVIANRVDLLDPVDRAVLQAAAVVGMQFWPGAVAAALGRAAGPVERSLRRLEQREFIAEQLESTMAGESEFRFQHVLVRDICYQRLPRTERIARHERTADWLETAWQRHDTDLAEVLAHHRWATHEIARSLRMPPGRYALAARRALYRAAQHAYTLHALDATASHIGRALSLLPSEPTDDAETDAESETDRLRLELFAAEIEFYRHRHHFLAGGGADQLRILAERLSSLEKVAGGEPTVAAARAYTLLAQEARLRADRRAGLHWLGLAVELADVLPDSSTKVDLYFELGRLHMLSYESEQAIAAAQTAAAIADRLGLREAATNARITIATVRYEAGDAAGLRDLQAITDECRGSQLVTLRRALRNLSHLLREEGDWQASQELFAESLQLDGPGGYNTLTDHSGEQMHAYFAGDLHRIRRITEVATPGRWEEVDDVGICLAGMRLDAAADDTVAATIQLARATGYYRFVWGVLSAAALYHALLGRRDEAAVLLTELTDGWRSVPVTASGQWINKAVVAAAITGPEPAQALGAQLRAGRRTRWCEAALHIADGALALSQDDPAGAGEQYLAAAALLAEIPSVTDRMLALALAASAFAQADDQARLTPLRAELTEFAEPAGAPGLLRIAGISAG